MSVAPAAAPARHADLVDRLARGIAALGSSGAWQRHLAFQSRFHRYSYGNVLLIAAQDAQATQVAGFRTWQRLNRCVRRGEKALWIVAPMRARPRPDDPDETAVRGFRWVPVFDIAQTVGDDPPSVCHRLRGEDPADLYGRFCRFAGSIGFSVVDHVFGNGTNGDCCPSERRIRVEAGNSPAQRTKTLVHELAHALLHGPGDDRPRAELEAESVAYVVCAQLGLDTGSYSFGYVAIWAGGGDEAVAQIRSSCRRIQQTAALILCVDERPAPAASPLPAGPGVLDDPGHDRLVGALR